MTYDAPSARPAAGIGIGIGIGMTIGKADVPAAGVGTGFLPATSATPREVLPDLGPEFLELGGYLADRPR